MLRIIRSSFSKTFERVFKREMGQWLIEFFKSFQGFGNIITIANLQLIGKYVS